MLGAAPSLSNPPSAVAVLGLTIALVFCATWVTAPAAGLARGPQRQDRADDPEVPELDEPALHGPVVLYHENGKKRLAATYEHGVLEGPYAEFYETGSIRLETTYRAGLEHGQRTEFTPSPRKTSTTIWVEGANVAPRSAKEIEHVLGDILPHPGSDTTLGRQREHTVRWIQAYRYLCDLPYADITLQEDRNRMALAATKLFDEIGMQTHEPWNPGWSSERFAEARTGAQDCNLHFWPGGTSPKRMVQSLAWDSDPPNERSLNHRRWLLSPGYKHLGVGFTSDYGAVWARDQSRELDEPIPWIAFPPPGLVPIDLFSYRDKEHPYVWSVFLDKRRFDDPQEDRVRVEVCPVDRRLNVGEPLPLSLLETVLEHVSGVEHSILFRPQSIEKNNGRYLVRILGLTRGAQEITIRYMVSFFTRRN